LTTTHKLRTEEESEEDCLLACFRQMMEVNIVLSDLRTTASQKKALTV